MLSKRLLLPVVGASMLLAAVGCGGTTQFAVGSMAVAGTPPAPPPPPPPPPPKEEPPQPPPRVELRDNKIEFKEKIQFEVAKSIIKPESDSLLHDIAEVIKKNPQVKKLSIEGHASAEGDAKANKKLSDDRAKAVMNHLVKKEGVEAARLVAKGWGEEKPIADNATDEGKEKNRRVEFLVVEADITQKKVEIDPKTGKERIVEEKKDVHKVDTGTPTGAEHGADPKKPDAKKPDTAAKPASPATPAKPMGSGAPAASAKPATPATPAK
jgi:outer membrane protein OmpA-like peptidoglycan-associated protein